MTILLLGSQGQLGQTLATALAPLGQVHALHRHSQPLAGDLEDLDGLRRTLAELRPRLIVNAAAYTAVDKAELPEEQARVQTVNVLAPGLLAEEAARLDAWLVHYSTDYVFDGSGSRPWRETDPTAPLNAYGRSKLAGEQAIQAGGCRHLILRTSWVYAPHGQNFANTMLRLAQTRDSLKVVDDQYGTPTSTELLARATMHALRQLQQHPEDGGLYHLASQGETTWFGYAQRLFKTARRLGLPLALPPEGLQPVPSSEYPTPARRPANSRLDCNKFQETFGLTLPGWEEDVDMLVRSYQAVRRV